MVEKEKMSTEELDKVSGGGILNRKGICRFCGDVYGLGDNEYDRHMCRKCKRLSDEERKSMFGDKVDDDGNFVVL